MSEPPASQSKEFSAQRGEFINWRRMQTFCRFMWATNLADFAGKKTVQEFYQEHGEHLVNGCFAKLKKGIWKKFTRTTGMDKHFDPFQGEKKERAIEHFWIHWSTETARQLTRYKNLGLDDALERGDEKALLLAKVKLRPFRRYPAYEAVIEKGLAHWAIGQGDWDWVEQLTKIRKQPAIDLSTFADKLEIVLLNFWVTPTDIGNGKHLRPLCFLNDKELTNLLEIMVDAPFSVGAVRKKWQRLGLLRSHFTA